MCLFTPASEDGGETGAREGAGPRGTSGHSAAMRSSPSGWGGGGTRRLGPEHLREGKNIRDEKLGSRRIYAVALDIFLNMNTC